MDGAIHKMDPLHVLRASDRTVAILHNTCL